MESLYKKAEFKFPFGGRNNKKIGIALVAVAVVILGILAYQNSHKRQQPLIFSPKFMLNSLWDTYKKYYWDPNVGRTVDTQRGGITTSEGQSYTMLRAVWQDDKPVFDKTWGFTRDILRRKQDNLFSWLYGKQQNGSYGILTNQGGQNTATDADTDIATALVFASVRWQDPTYMEEAKKIIQDIWSQEVVYINGTPYITADNIEKNSPTGVLVNPSYYAPYSYRLFAKIDPTHDWNSVINSSYDVLDKVSSSSIDKKSSSGLPPDWIVIDRKTGQIKAAPNDTLTTNYSYDAMRTPFRLALDWKWNNEQRAKEILSRYGFLDQQWESRNKLSASYAHDGQVISDSESPAIYGGSLGYFFVIDPKTAKQVYQQKLESLYSPDYQAWKQVLSYYDDNWSWFALALYNNDLVNLAPVK